MAPNSLSPSYIVISYHSLFGTHKMTLPTRQFTPGIGGGTYEAWDASTVDADTMITDFVDLIKPFFPATVSFDFYEIFNKATAIADSVFMFAATLTQVGTSVVAGWSKAAEATFSFKTNANGEYKITLLDF